MRHDKTSNGTRQDKLIVANVTSKCVFIALVLHQMSINFTRHFLSQSKRENQQESRSDDIAICSNAIDSPFAKLKIMDQELVYPNVAGEEEVVFSSQEAALSDGRIQAAELMISMAASGHSDVSITSEALHEEGVDVSHSGDIPMIVSMPSEQHSELGNKDPGRIRQRARIEVMEYNDVGDKQELPEDLVIITGKSEQDNVSSYPSGHILSQGFSGDIGNTITLRQMLTGLGSEKEVVKQHSEMETSVQNLIHSTYEQVVEEDGGSNTVVIEMPYGGGDNVIVSAQSENVPMNGTIATDVCVGNNYVKDGEVITVSGDQALDATGEMINVSLQGFNNYKCHLRIHDKLATYTCDMCPFLVFQLRKHFISHLDDHEIAKEHYIPGQALRLICFVCNKEFCDRGQLRRHQQYYHSDKSYKCSVCGKAFCERAKLQRHMLIHNGRRDFTEKEFTFRKYKSQYHLSNDLKNN
ncbi:PRD10-like protein [Mya arenaria]|uniref:PRD10-like protein n=1 Tax=Mya arenaria TaxID=6604 RepID=A0ABY7EJN4_MYAAR|nr:PRD10-like protein [Mya arenaria]